MAIFIVGIHIHTLLQQHGDHGSMAPPCSHMQWGLTTRVLQVEVSALGRHKAHSLTEAPHKVRWATETWEG